jgi:hypothetical protein
MNAESRASGGFPFKLPKPAERALAAAGYTRLEQLSDVAEADLRSLHGVGPNVIERLRGALAERGLSFSDDDTPKEHAR